MLGENIRTLRKNKGYSQEALANQLNVVRQTVSKWEKGLSVPDAEMLGQIAELFETPVSTLLGSDIPEKEDGQDLSALAQQLAILNEHLAGTTARRRRAVRRTLIGVAIGLVVLIGAGLIFLSGTSHSPFRPAQPSFSELYLKTTRLTCTLDEKTYEYTIVSSTESGATVFSSASAFAWLPYGFEREYISNANELIFEIEHYYRSNGGVCISTATNGSPDLPLPGRP